MAVIRKNLSGRLLHITHAGGVVFGDFVYEPGGKLGPRTQADYQLVLLYSGSLEIQVEGQGVVTLRPGEMCVLAPGGRELMTFAPAVPAHHGWCAVRPGSLAALPEARLLAAARAREVVVISERAAQLMAIAFPIPEQAAPGLLESIACAVMEEFLRIVEAGASDPARPPLPEPVRRARDFVEAHYPEPLDLARLGRAAGVAPKHLGKLFRRHLGVTPVRHLWQVRTARGAQLLTGTGLTLGEIAERVGFQNPFHFSRLIRQEFGVSPRQLRAERWNGVARESKHFSAQTQG